MKISEETVRIFKNFSEINNSMTIERGKVIRTIAEADNILASAKIEESFPVEFCIYDLPEFLAVISLYKGNAEFKFGKDNVIINNGAGDSSTYYYADSSLMKEIKVIEDMKTDISFVLERNILDRIRKAASVTQSPDISIMSKTGKTISIIVHDVKNDTAPRHVFEVGKGNGKKFNVLMKVEYLCLLPKKYNVSISAKGLSHFVSDDDTVEYWIATETGSKVEC